MILGDLGAKKAMVLDAIQRVLILYYAQVMVTIQTALPSRSSFHNMSSDAIRRRIPLPQRPSW